MTNHDDMPSASSTATGDTEGVDGVRKWVRETGYPLEYASARTLQKVGFQTFQGVHYVTARADLPKAREVDIVANVGVDQEGLVYMQDLVTVRLVVECKVLKTPWVVLTRPTRSMPNLIHGAIGTRKAREGLLSVIESGGTLPDLLVTPERSGFSIVEARIPSASERRGEERKRADERIDGAYAALAQVVSAAHGLAGELKEGWSLYWPLIVVRGPLFHLGYDDDGEEILESVEWQRVMWMGHPDGRTHVDVVRERHLEPYARTAKVGLSFFAERLAALSRAVARKHG